MSVQLGVGQALAELVRRLTPEEKREFVRWFSWQELDLLRQEEKVAPLAAETARWVGEPRVYVGTTLDGLALELPVASVPTFVKRLPDILSASSIEVYVRRSGRTAEYRVRGAGFADFVNAHQDTLCEESVMLELDGATLVSGGGGCMLLTLSDANREMRRRLAAEALRACGFDYEFTEDRFIAAVWNDALEVSER